MVNKDKSEQHFSVTSVKRIAIFQASLKLVREEAGAPFSSRGNNNLTSHGANCDGRH